MPTATMPNLAFKSCAERVLRFAEMQAVLIRCRKDYVMFVAAGGHRMARVVYDIRSEMRDEFDLNISKNDLQTVARGIRSNRRLGDVSISQDDVGGSVSQLGDGGVSVQWQKSAAVAFPTGFERLYPSEFVATALVNLGDIRAAAYGAEAALTSRQIPAVKLTLDGECTKLVLTAERKKFRFETTLAATGYIHSMKDSSFGLAPDYFADTFRYLMTSPDAEDEVSLAWTADINGPIKINQPKKNATWADMLIMPIVPRH